MSNELTNLLSPSRMRIVRRAYFLRLGTLALITAAIVIAVHGLMLIPAYRYLTSEHTSRQQVLNKLTAQLTAEDKGAVSARLSALNQKTEFLAGLAAVPSVANAVRAVLSVPRTGITLSRMTYAAGGKGSLGTMTLVGVAATRNDLQQYQTAFEQTSFVSTANLPVDVYVKDTNLQFTMTLTGTLQS